MLMYTHVDTVVHTCVHNWPKVPVFARPCCQFVSGGHARITFFFLAMSSPPRSLITPACFLAKIASSQHNIGQLQPHTLLYCMPITQAGLLVQLTASSSDLCVLALPDQHQTSNTAIVSMEENHNHSINNVVVVVIVSVVGIIVVSHCCRCHRHHRHSFPTTLITKVLILQSRILYPS